MEDRGGPDDIGRSIFGAGLEMFSLLTSGTGVLGRTTSSFEFGLTILIAELPFFLGVWKEGVAADGPGVLGVGVPGAIEEFGRSEIADPERDIVDAMGPDKFGFWY